MTRVLFLHGWCSDGSTKTMFLQSLGYDVLTPKVSHWFFSKAVAQAQETYGEFRPDVIVGSSRGGTVAMNMERGNTPLILLAPAWKQWGKARTIKKNTVVIHSVHDEIVAFQDSVELCEASGVRLISAGDDHQLNCNEGRRAMERALGLVLGEAPRKRFLQF